MQDLPDAGTLLALAADVFRAELHGAPPTSFERRVAINALDLASRELALAPAAHAAEHRRLAALLGSDGTLSDLNNRLCAAIRNDAVPRDVLLEHLWLTAVEKLAVDQPTYSTLRFASAHQRIDDA